MPYATGLTRVICACMGILVSRQERVKLMTFLQLYTTNFPSRKIQKDTIQEVKFRIEGEMIW